jgi:DNA-binding NarL/FixJ family response regulator
VPGKGELLLRRGQVQEALRLLEGIVPECETKRGLHLEPWPALARVRLALADSAGALAATEAALQRWRDQGAPAAHEQLLGTAIEVYLATGHQESAAAILAQLARFAQRPATPSARAHFGEACGQVAACEVRHAEAAAQFRAVAVLWHEMGATYREARTRRLRAGSLLQIGDADRRAEATDELAAARAICLSLGAGLELEAIAAVTSRYGLAPASTRLASGHRSGLTRREREVIACIARGYSNRAIAEALVITERTVEHHVSNILGKLGCTCRAQAAAYAVEHELTAPSPG